MTHRRHADDVANGFDYALADAFSDSHPTSVDPMFRIAERGSCAAAVSEDWFCTDKTMNLCQEEYTTATTNAECFGPVPFYDHDVPQSSRFRITPMDGFDALELLCYVATDAVTCGNLKADELPEINGLNDLSKLSQFLTCQGESLRARIGRLLLQDMPKSVVEAVKNGPGAGDFGGAGGERRALLGDITVGLRDLQEAADRVRGVLGLMANDVDWYRASMDEQRIQNEIAVLDNMHQMTMTLLDVAYRASSISILNLIDPKGSGPGQAAALAGMAVAAAKFAFEKDALLRDAGDAADRRLTADLYGRLQQRALDMQTEFAAVLRAYELVRMRLAAYKDLVNAAQRMASRVRLEVSEGKSATDRINAMYRARFNTARVRYGRALEAARKLAFIARRAIEFRLGVNMGTMNEDLPLVPPPARWYKDVCIMEGIDYERIVGGTPFGEADAGTGDAGAADGGEGWTPDYSASYIGDYVRLLRNFVESYGLAYPFTDTSDLAVLSLRDDIYQTAQTCERDSYNLVLFSDDIGGGLPLEEVDNPEMLGWRTQGCTVLEDRLTVSDHFWDPPQPRLADVTQCVGRVVDDPESACAAGSTGYSDDCRGSWILDDSGKLVVGPAGLAERIFDTCVPAETEIPNTPDSGSHVIHGQAEGPTNSAEAICAETPSYTGYYAQRVGGLVPGGSYLLSWYAKRAGETDNTPYTIAVHEVLNTGETTTVSPTALVSYSDLPPVPWQRLAMMVIPAAGGSGEIEIRVHPSAAEDTLGRLYLRSMQLERTRFAGTDDAVALADDARPFELVTVNRRLAVAACPDSDGRIFRNRFQRLCMCRGEREGICFPGAPNADPTRCFYQGSFTISLNDVESGELIPSASLARDNFNYRHESLGMNLVGTGVRVCYEESPEMCFSNGFVPFTFVHSGYSAVRNHTWDLEYFNMPDARIERGKGLAAEIVVTNPPTAASTGLLEPFTRDELRGRPLDGGYVIRLWDIPELDWGHVEDVQLVLKYRYWTPMTASE
jgi:hypothetical protein